MLSYHHLPEELNRRVLRVLQIMLVAYVLPLWMQLIYMGEAADASEMVSIWNIAMHPMTLTLLVENLVMPAYVLVLEVVQSRVRNFWLYLGVQLAGMAVMWYALPDRDGGMPRLIVCAVLLCTALYARIHETHLGYPVPGWLVMGILMVLVGEQGDLHDMCMAGYATEMVEAVLVVLYHNALALDHALEHTRSAGGVPYDKVRWTNVVIMSLWIVLSAVVILVMILSGVGDVLYDAFSSAGVWLTRQLIRFLIWIISILPHADSYKGTASAMKHLQMGETNSINAFLAMILSAIWETLVAFSRLVSLIVAVGVIVHLCKSLYRSYMAASPEERHPIGWQLTRDRVVTAGSRSSKRLSPLDPSPAARIRRSYVRLLKKGEGYSGLRPSMTPAEQMTVSVNCAPGPDLPDDSVIREIRLLYEKARYLPLQCTLQDVHAMRRAVQEMESRL